MSITDSDRIMVARLGTVIAQVATGGGKTETLLAAAKDCLELAIEIEWALANAESQAGKLKEADRAAQRTAAIRTAKDAVSRFQDAQRNGYF